MKCSGKFVVAYFGQVFNERIRNPRLLFEAIRKLEERGESVVDDLLVNWFVDDRSEDVVKRIVAEYALEKYMDYHAFVKQEELPDKMIQSSVLLILNNIPSEKRYFGIMTTKFSDGTGDAG